MSDEIKKCPNCGLINPKIAQICDCKYNFDIESDNKMLNINPKGILRPFLNGIGLSIIMSFCITGIVYISIYFLMYVNRNISESTKVLLVLLLLFIIAIPSCIVKIFIEKFQRKYLVCIPIAFTLGLAYVYFFYTYTTSYQNKSILSAYADSIGRASLILVFMAYCVSGWISYFLLKNSVSIKK